MGQRNCRIAFRRSGGLQCLRQIRQYVLLVLDADRQAYIAIGDPGLQLLFGGQLRMRRRCRMNREAARIADIGDVVEHLERIDKAPPGIPASLQFEAEEPAISALQIGVGATARLAFHEREVVAHHEMGHALVALSLPGTDKVHKVSIIPRGIGALGYTIQRPTEDRFLMKMA